MIQSIPLKKLVPSPRNVRKSSDVLADLQLRADIAARGLLQNLVVRKGKRGKFEVEAGGRRLLILPGPCPPGEALGPVGARRNLRPVGPCCPRQPRAAGFPLRGAPHPLSRPLIGLRRTGPRQWCLLSLSPRSGDTPCTTASSTN